MVNRNPAQSLRPHQSSLIFAALAAIAAWYVPVLHYAMLPLQYLNTHTHEMCHALVAAATGGDVDRILVFANGSGVTPVAGGSILLEGSAGYVGAAVIGAIMVFYGRTPQRAKTTLFILGAFIAFSMLFWVRGDTIGVISGLFWVCSLFGMASSLRGAWALFAAQFIGVEQCLTSLHSLLSLMDLSVSTEAQSDARLLGAATHLPAIFWALSWSVISATLVIAALRSAWKSQS